MPFATDAKRESSTSGGGLAFDLACALRLDFQSLPPPPPSFPALCGRTSAEPIVGEGEDSGEDDDAVAEDAMTTRSEIKLGRCGSADVPTPGSAR